MKKQFTKRVGYIIVVAMAVTVVLVFILQTLTAYQNADKELDNLFANIERQVNDNNASIETLKDSLDADYLSRAKAFAYMIEQNPRILNSSIILSDTAKLLDVDELHVIDEKGIIQWGTVPGYFGFDMASSEQTKPFMEILNDSSIELAQEPQINGAAGILFQYIGVARRDAKGFVQIGMQPTRLEQAMANNEIGVVLNRIGDENKHAFAVNKEDDTIINHANPELIGLTLEEAGVKGGSAVLLNNYRSGKIGGESVRMGAREIGDYIIVAQINRGSFMTNRNIQSLLLVVSDILIIVIMIMAIARLLDKQIVSPIKVIADNLKSIEGGNLEQKVTVNSCPEFVLLSEGINSMVGSIKEKMNQSELLIANQRDVSSKMHGVADKLRRLSDSNLSTADDLAHGSVRQADAINEMTDNIRELSDQMKHDGENAAIAEATSQEAAEMLDNSVAELGRLADVMRQMNQMSNDIQNVVNAIDSISFQTNILALNAAVEAARAGAAGKGFAVVADEVRNLAGKSADSAKQTAEMIGQTIDIMRSGEMLSNNAEKMVRTAMDKFRQANKLTGEIVHASARQGETVNQIFMAGEQVSSVVQENSRLAGESKDGVVQLLREVEQLQKLAAQDVTL
ncbi:MAG: HAMP domain-containing protein [Oscillospiraceae bacterium]|nr:HAMP domain-containing protein [Oscillospiraceae bacterium]